MNLKADDLYAALTSRTFKSQPRRLTYRCAAKKCLLLDVWDAEQMGMVLHQPRYRFSETENFERSSESGRASNTTDGVRRWKSSTFYSEESALSLAHRDATGAQLDVSCDHVLAYPLTAHEFWADWDNRHVMVRIRPDYSRYTVE